MRDLTKSMLSFSWAMSVFGVQQAANCLIPQSLSQPTHKATQAFNTVTQATEEQFGDALKGIFTMGDHLQKGMVDMTANVLTLEAFNPSNWMKMASDTMRQDTSTISSGAQSAASNSQQEPASWGPVPPPEN